MVPAVSDLNQYTQQLYNNPHNNWITKKSVKSVEIQELVQEPKQFGDCFKNNTKRLLPYGAALTGLLTVIDVMKANKISVKSLCSHISSVVRNTNDTIKSNKTSAKSLCSHISSIARKTIDTIKSDKTSAKSLCSNICFMAPVILAISVVSAYFQSGNNVKK